MLRDSYYDNPVFVWSSSVAVYPDKKLQAQLSARLAGHRQTAE
jgi:hypothetical protein